MKYIHALIIEGAGRAYHEEHPLLFLGAYRWESYHAAICLRLFFTPLEQLILVAGAAV